MQDELNIVTGNNAESFVAQELSKKGAWVGDFNKGNTGAQPFDQIAITDKYTLCYDVKHCSKDRFDFNRVEENQKLSLGYINSLDNANVFEGFAIVYESIIYWLSYFEYLSIVSTGRKSVKVTTLAQILGVI